MASKTKGDHRFTDAEKTFLRDNIGCYTYPQLTQVFNENFGTSLTHGNISDMCLKRMGIKRDKNWAFPRGKKDFVYSCPIGTESRCGREIFIKIADTTSKGRTPSKGSDRNWKRKQEIIYEKAYGRIPGKGMIVFLDKNRNNFDIDNLYCTDRKVNFMMAKNGWYSSDPVMTLTAIKWCELFYAIKEA